MICRYVRIAKSLFKCTQHNAKKQISQPGARHKSHANFENVYNQNCAFELFVPTEGLASNVAG